MNKEERFVDLFNQLDAYLRIKHFNNNPSYTSYSRKLFYIKKRRLEPVFENDHDFDLLKKAGDIRNIIVHNNHLIIPSDEFLSQFQKLVERITAPLRVDQIMTHFKRLKTLTLEDTLRAAIELMNASGYASIPVLKSQELIGFFTQKTVFDYLTISERIVDLDMRLDRLFDVIDLDGKPREYFKFIPRTMTIDQAYQIYTEDFRDKHQLILLLVTEHGKREESLLGIVALRDLKNALYD